MVAKKIREWNIPFVTLRKNEEPPNKEYCLNYIRVNRIEKEIHAAWKDVFDQISKGCETIKTVIREFSEVANENSSSSK